MEIHQPHDNEDGPQFNYLRYSAESFTYNMNCNHKGLAVIINNSNFCPDRLKARKGSEEDVKVLRKALIKRGFFPEDIKVHANKTREEMAQILAQEATRDFSEYGCLVIVVLSYGAQNKVWATDNTVTYQELLQPFTDGNVPSLFDKPRFLLIQTECDTVDAISCAAQACSDDLAPCPALTEPDVLVGYSLDPVQISNCTDGKGSYFIQRFCEALCRDGANLNMVDLLTRVNGMVREDKGSYVRHGHTDRVYCPRIISLLTKCFKLG